MSSSTLQCGGAIGARAYSARTVTYEFRIKMTKKIAVSAVCSEKKPRKARSQGGGVGGGGAAEEQANSQTCTVEESLEAQD
jgi:hypothetical protein